MPAEHTSWLGLYIALGFSSVCSVPLLLAIAISGAAHHLDVNENASCMHAQGTTLLQSSFAITMLSASSALFRHPRNDTASPGHLPSNDWYYPDKNRCLTSLGADDERYHHSHPATNDLCYNASDLSNAPSLIFVLSSGMERIRRGSRAVRSYTLFVAHTSWMSNWRVGEIGLCLFLAIFRNV